MNTTQLFEIRFSSAIGDDLEPRIETVLQELENGASLSDDDKAFADFALAERRIAVKRQNNNTVAVSIPIEAVKELKKELTWRKQDLEATRYDERDNIETYRYVTSLISQCITAIKNCNKILIEHG